MAKIDAFFKLTNEHKASHLYLGAGHLPALRINGEFERVKYKEIDNDELLVLIQEIMSKEQIGTLETTGDVHFTYEVTNLGRFRCHIYMQHHGVAGIFKELHHEIRTIEELNLPPAILKLSSFQKGMIIIRGQRESGKSTTIATIIQELNRTRKAHIVTVENPIEFVFKNEQSFIEQQEVGIHTQSYLSGFQNAIKLNADIIFLDDIKDPETFALALEAACNDTLVLATLTNNHHISDFFDFILNQYPKDPREQIRANLMNGLIAVIRQVLLKRKDVKEYCVASEILFNCPDVRKYFYSNKLNELGRLLISGGEEWDHRSLDDSIDEYIKMGWIDIHDAFSKVDFKNRFRPLLKRPVADFTIL